MFFLCFARRKTIQILVFQLNNEQIYLDCNATANPIDLDTSTRDAHKLFHAILNEHEHRIARTECTSIKYLDLRAPAKLIPIVDGVAALCMFRTHVARN